MFLNQLIYPTFQTDLNHSIKKSGFINCWCRCIKVSYRSIQCSGLLKALYTLFSWQTFSISDSISTNLRSIHQYAIINARKLLVHISTTVYSHTGTHLYSWINWSNVEWNKIAQGFNITAQESNPGPLRGESETLPLSHYALQIIYI